MKTRELLMPLRVVQVAPLILLVSMASQSNLKRSAKNYTGPVQPNKLEESIFGLGYAALKPKGFAAVYRQSGIRSIKLPDVRWQYIEPKPPRGGKHKYAWWLMDMMVREFEYHDFYMQVILRAKSNWASRTLRNKRLSLAGAGIATTLPKDEYLDDYAAWVEAVVERYDGDGQDDMPRLKYPILHWEFESEAQHEAAWQGTVDEYIEMLRIAYKAVKKACPQAKVILSGFDFGDVHDDFPDEKTIQQRFARIRSAGRRDLAFIEKTLQQKDIYDVIEFHYNRDYKGIFGEMEHIRRFSDKPVWAGDATSGPFLFASPDVYFNPPYPQMRAQGLYKGIARGDKKITAWYRAEQARFTTKKFVCGAGCGVQKIMMALTAIWKAPPGVGGFHTNFAIQNMLDENLEPLPVFHTMKLLVDKLDGFTGCKRLRMGGRDTYIYEFTVRGKPVYVLWCDDNRNHLPGERMASRPIQLPVKAGNVLVTYIITEMGRTEARSEIQPVNAGNLALTITETPVIVEPR